MKACLGSPVAVQADPAGNIFIAANTVAAKPRDITCQIQEVVAATHIIKTIAGNGVPGYTGDGGLATQAEMGTCGGLALDMHGNLFIADVSHGVIREVDETTGVIKTLAGNGTFLYSGDGGQATKAGLYDPTGLAVDSHNDLFIADTGHNAIREVDETTGIIKTIAGNGTAGYAGDGGPAIEAQLNQPAGVAIDPRGDLYIADARNNLIREVDGSTGIIKTIAGDGTAGHAGDGGPAIKAQLNQPRSVAVDPHGDLFIADGERIREVTTDGTIRTVAGNGQSPQTRAEIAAQMDTLPATQAEFGVIGSITLDSDNNILVADSNSHLVREVVR